MRVTVVWEEWLEVAEASSLVDQEGTVVRRSISRCVRGKSSLRVSEGQSGSSPFRIMFD